MPSPSNFVRAVIALATLTLLGCEKDHTTKWVEVTSTDSKIIESGPVTLKACASDATFVGEFACYVTPATACGRSATETQPSVTPVCDGPTDFTWRGEVHVPAASVVCCGAHGAGGRIKLSYDQ